MKHRRTNAELLEQSSRDEPETRWCSGCQAYRPKEEFARCKRQGRQRLCRTHRAEYMRNYRAARPGAEAERYRVDPEHATKVRARKRVGMRRHRGTLEPQPCERCGASAAQSHHDDYSRPLRVRWLCVRCHGAEHYPDAQPGAVEKRWDRLAAKYGLGQDPCQEAASADTGAPCSPSSSPASGVSLSESGSAPSVLDSGVAPPGATRSPRSTR